VARPPLVLETWGKIKRSKTAAGTHIASAKFRDSDGKTRRMARTGTSPNNAEQNLLEALKKRLAPTDEGLTATTRIAELADAWWDEWSAAKDRPLNTERRYRGVLQNHIVESLGGVMLREATVPRLDRFLKAKTASAGYSTASIAKVILSGMFGMAARHGAIGSDPVAATAPIPKPGKTAKAWTIDEIADIRTKLRSWDAGTDASGRARVSDLAGPCDFMLGTGVRPGETFAVRWPDIDFTATPPTVRIHATVIRSETFGLMIQEHTKSDKVLVLKLPAFVVAGLLERRISSFTETVFPSSTGTIRSPDNFRVQWHTALGHTPLLSEVPKTFRSSVATHVSREKGADVAKGQLGHSSVTITEKFYIEANNHAVDVTDTLEGFNVFATEPDDAEQVA
jgi:integrase